MPPCVSLQAVKMRSTIAVSKRISFARGRSSQIGVTSNARPADVIIGALPISAAIGAASSVADITTISSRLVVNQAALKVKRALLQPVIDAFAGAVKP